MEKIEYIYPSYKYWVIVRMDNNNANNEMIESPGSNLPISNNLSNEHFLVHRELLKDVHLELKVKLLLPENLYSDIMEMYKTRYQYKHKKKLDRVHHNLLLRHVHYDLDSVLNYTYCENECCSFDHYENKFNVLNKNYVEGKVLNFTYSYCCKNCYSYDKWSKEYDFRKFFRRDPDHGRLQLQQWEMQNPQDSIQLDNFRNYMNENRGI